MNCLRRFELASVCPNCGEHSTIVRMSSTALYTLQPLPELDAPADLMARGPAGVAPVDPRGRLRPPRRAGRRRAGRRRAHDPRRRDGRPLRAAAEHGPAGRRGAGRARCTTPAATRRPPDGRAARAPRRRASPRPAPTASRSTSRRRRTPTTRSRPCATRAAAPGLALCPSTPVAGRRRSCSTTSTCVLCMTVNPGWGGQAFLPGSLASSSGCARSLGDGPALEVDGGIDARTAGPVRRARARPCSWQDRPCSARRTRRRPTARWRPPHDG